MPPYQQNDDWVLQFDLDYNEDGHRKNSPFPAHIAATENWLDGITISDKLKSVMWLELTSLWEENLAVSYIRNKSNYNKLESECRSQGSSVIPQCVEADALGHVNTTWGMLSKDMGMKRVERE